MKRTGIRKLELNKETLRRLVADDLVRVGGGRLSCCTYRYSGCIAGSDDCPTVDTFLCDSKHCQ